jgi:hypothetical protein
MSVTENTAFTLSAIIIKPPREGCKQNHKFFKKGNTAMG